MYDEYDDMGAVKKVLKKAPPRDYYGLTIDFDTTIAAAGSSTKNAKTDGNYLFIAESLQIVVWTPIAISSTIAGMEYAMRSEATVTATVGNTLPTHSHFRISITINDRVLTRTPVRVSLLNGRGNGPHYLLTKINVRPGETVFATLYNDSAQTCQAQALFEGYYQKP